MTSSTVQAFNGPVEIGLRNLVVLVAAFPVRFSLERLVVYDYLIVHSEDIDGGPPSLHPKTPYRGGELLIRRASIQDGLLLYQSRGLVTRHYDKSGVLYSATEMAGSFLDTLESPYVKRLIDRSTWLIERFGDYSDGGMHDLISHNIGEWGAEFSLDSVLWRQDVEE